MGQRIPCLVSTLLRPARPRARSFLSPRRSKEPIQDVRDVGCGRSFTAALTWSGEARLSWSQTGAPPQLESNWSPASAGVKPKAQRGGGHLPTAPQLDSSQMRWKATGQDGRSTTQRISLGRSRPLRSSVTYGVRLRWQVYIWGRLGDQRIPQPRLVEQLRGAVVTSITAGQVRGACAWQGHGLGEECVAGQASAGRDPQAGICRQGSAGRDLCPCTS